ncbi:hypothetical protein HON52_03260 [Candidatus Uhrbacteria bacterium]|jgi:hypothetical protein|nr:hypothetical protein [Candidatus Uhrbacteria bacterium]
MKPSEFMSQPSPKKKLIINRNDDELRGRFADTFSVQFNGDNFAIEFFTKMPRRDGSIEQTLVSRIFMTQKGMSALAKMTGEVIEKIDSKNIKKISSGN